MVRRTEREDGVTVDNPQKILQVAGSDWVTYVLGCMTPVLYHGRTKVATTEKLSLSSVARRI